MARGNFPLGNPQGFNPGQPGPQGMLDTSAVNDILKPYGVSLPTSLQQPGVAENTGWGQRHPGLSRGIDNALIAVGGMGPTGDTAGENISNAARGVMGIGPFRQQYAQEQMALPLTYAKEIGGLQAQQAENKMREAQADWYGDRSQNAQQANLLKLQTAQMRDAMTGGKEPQIMTDPTGKKYVGVPWIDPNDPSMALQWQRTNIDPDAFMKEHARTRVASRFGGGPAGALLEGALSNKYGGPEKIPDGLSVDDIKMGVGILNQASGNVMRINDKDLQDAYKRNDDIEADIFHKSLPKLELTKEESKQFEDEAKSFYAATHPQDQGGRYGAGANLAGKKAVRAELDRRQAEHDTKLQEFGSYFMSTTQDERHQIGGFQAWKTLQNPAALVPAAPVTGSPQNFKGIHPNPDASSTGPKPGDVEDGYQFLGGDKSDPKSWKAVR